MLRLLTGRACTCACVRARTGRQQGTQGSALRGKTLCMSTAVMPVAYNMACEAPCRHHTARAVRSTAQHGTARARAQMSANLQKDYSPSGPPRPAQDCQRIFKKITPPRVPRVPRRTVSRASLTPAMDCVIVYTVPDTRTHLPAAQGVVCNSCVYPACTYVCAVGSSGSPARAPA